MGLVTVRTQSPELPSNSFMTLIEEQDINVSSCGQSLGSASQTQPE